MKYEPELSVARHNTSYLNIFQINGHRKHGCSISVMHPPFYLIATGSSYTNGDVSVVCLVICVIYSL